MKIIEFSALECMQLKGPIETNLENCIYILRRDGVVEYVGSTIRPASQRLREHSIRIEMDGVQVEIMKYEAGEVNEKELRQIERGLINKFRPKRNRRMERERPLCTMCGKNKSLMMWRHGKLLCYRCYMKVWDGEHA